MQFTRTLNRVQPQLPVTMMKTFAILAPVATHFRPATCEEIGCMAFHYGWSWETGGKPQEMVDAVKKSGRKYTTAAVDGGELLVFEAGQPCFKASAHRMRVERPEIFLTRNGDWRGNPDGPSAEPLIHSGPDAWADDLNTTLEACTDG